MLEREGVVRRMMNDAVHNGRKLGEGDPAQPRPAQLLSPTFIGMATGLVADT